MMSIDARSEVSQVGGRTCRSQSSWSSRPRGDGVQLFGPGGLLDDVARTLLETAIKAGMSVHLG
jgi:hypothetical protein